MRDRLTFREVLNERVIVADGAMGTMLQEYDLDLDQFEGHEGCNDILNLTRPDIVRETHAAFLAVGTDCIGTNTFSANYGGLVEYGIEDRSYEIAEAGARIAREVADDYSTPEHPRYVLGSMGPGTRLPTLGHVSYAHLRDYYEQSARGLIEGGSDAILIETSQDLLQIKAAVVGTQRAKKSLGKDVPIIAQVAIEQNGAMLMGSEIGAALTSLEPLGIDIIGINCSTGPAEMSEHLRYLSQHARVPISCMPNAGLPQLGPNGAEYTLTPDELADAHDTFTGEFGLSLVGGCCGTTPEHLRKVVERVQGREIKERNPLAEPALSSLYQSVPFRQDASYLAVGERTNANGSKKFREAMLAEDWDACVEIARDQISDGAHVLDLNIDYVGRDGAADMREIASRFSTSSTLPIMLDSTEPAVLQAGLESLGGRAVINSVNYEDGVGPDSRFSRIMSLASEHGAALVGLCIDEDGQARTADWKLKVATRLIEQLTGEWGMRTGDIVIDCLTFPITTGQEETRRDGIETLEAIRRLKERFPEVQTTLGLSNLSFGINPAARIVLNSVFLHEAVKVGLDSAIVHASKILPINQIPEDQVETALDMIYDRRTEDYDPLGKFIDMFQGVDAAAMKASRADQLAELPLWERLEQRIIDGEAGGMEDDLQAALDDKSALEIVNDHLLAGMKTVGELFGSGQMQLPFVLKSAEVMKSAVAYLEPHMEKSDDDGKGRILLATVKGDVHDIGKNLVDIILSNNGYDVVNLGIKQPVNAILESAEQERADVIGMSGLLVKSTVIMKENLEEMNSRGISDKYPVLLGGAALTRSFVEQDLADIFDGEVRYAKDAFEGLSLMDAMMAVKRGEEGAKLPELRGRKVKRGATLEVTAPEDMPARSDVATDNPVPEPPFWGSRISKGIPLADYTSFLDERAVFMGQWGLKGARGGNGPTYQELVETEGRPRMRSWLDRIRTDGLLEAAVVHGYFPCYSEGDDLVILEDDGRTERERFSFPRQRRDRHLCLSDFYRPKESGEIDVAAFQVVTVGSGISQATAELFEKNAYRDYLELHGLSVQLTEALAEYWHTRVRAELGFAGDDPAELEAFFKLGYRGARFSLGYGACPELEDRAKIMRLLEPERVGVKLSEEFQLVPEQATDAIVIHHPEATYFNV
ncbi:methionine synthase [Nocardiopsis kunsanensis]|uniref:Methionine synthase n=1 Tax=Nocardiopsis kunsanensis TaxID=141693 RepID=A0A918X9S8_9ACTN|nr:methionine synthase [Nocardiopsis kunsanensis]GHD20248.1 methionine synthase [Nocardiopsis kunsanensis]